VRRALRYHIDEHKNYIQKIMNKWQSVYRIAHAATGSSELAELVLQEALLDAYVHLDDGSIRENMRRAVSESALKHIKVAQKAGHLEQDWDCFTSRPEALGEADEPLWEFMSEQTVQVKRIVVLKYALHWSYRQIADVMDMHTGEVKDAFVRAMAQLQRRDCCPSTAVARNVRISPFDRAMNRILRLELSKPGEDLPDIGAVMQAFEQDAAAVRRPNMTARKLTGGVVRMAVVLLVALLFYLAAVMAQDPFDQGTHISPTDSPDATVAPVLKLPALGGYEMIDAGRQMAITDLSELEYYFSMPVARLSAEGWGLKSAYVRDERGMGGTTTRAAVIEYMDASGRTVRLRSMLPGAEACQRLEDQMAYMGDDAQIGGQTAVQLQSGLLCRAYTMIGQAVYCIEGELPMEELTALAGHVNVAEQDAAGE
jgi:DNA-directed RNA polymerase specialized sigma24 family protein